MSVKICKPVYKGTKLVGWKVKEAIKTCPLSRTEASSTKYRLIYGNKVL